MEEHQRQQVAELYGRCAAQVHAYARRRADVSVADDVVMEVFVIACRRLDDVPEDPLPWLLGCARRVLANHRRGLTRAVALTDSLASVAAMRAADACEAGRLAAALEQLTPTDQEVLMLSAWEGLDLNQLAQAVGCSRGAAAVRLHRARKRLRQGLSDRQATHDQARPEEVAS